MEGWNKWDQPEQTPKAAPIIRTEDHIEVYTDLCIQLDELGINML